MHINFHTHTKLCNHAVGETEDYVKSAIAKGFRIIGMSDHGTIPESFMDKNTYHYLWLQRHMRLEQMENIYFKQIDECKLKYADKIKIYKGLEIEYLSNHIDYYKWLKNKVDYLILGPHFYQYNNKIMNVYETTTRFDNIDGFANTIEEALDTKLFSFLAHPDIFMFNYISKDDILHKWDEKCEQITRRIVESTIKNDVFIELNCGAVHLGKNKFNEFYYPRSEFWKIVKQYPNAKIVIGRDAHDYQNFNDEITKVIEKFARELGLNIIEDYDIRKE
ncbi:MAG: PHP domain-containing protein [Bacilli bacterium]|nr:PHP domain-containing protein [Bacilli bacterium]